MLNRNRAPAPIQATQTFDCAPHQAARRPCFRSSNTQFLDLKHKTDLFTDRRTLNVRQDISQKPAHVSSPYCPLVWSSRALRWTPAQSNAPAPTLNVKVNHLTIGIGQHHPGLGKIAKPCSTNRHSAFAIETSGRPTKLTYRRFYERARSVFSKALFQSVNITFGAQTSVTCFAANATTTRAVTRSDVEILRRAPMTIHTVCFVTRRQPHIERVT